MRPVSQFIASLALSMAWSTGGCFAQVANVQPQNYAQSRETPLEEVVVTASKRPQRLMDAPLAVTALTDSEIDRLGFQGFTDYMSSVPSLEFNSDGAPGVGTIILRGINAGYSQVSQTVGFYIDNVPFTESSNGYGAVNPDPDLNDVDRVEILKGPQSTLFGASALGGLVRIINKRPDLNIYSGELRVDGTAVDGGGYGGAIRGIANLPIVSDHLALRVTAFDRFEPGYVDNVQTGAKHVNESRLQGGRMAVRFQPNSSIDLQLDAFVQNIHSNGVVQEDLDPATLQPLEGRYKYASYFNPTMTSNYAGISLDGHYYLSWGSITDTVSYSMFHGHSDYDFTNSYAPLFDEFGSTSPDQALRADFKTPLNKFAEEFRVETKRLGPVEMQGGLFYTHENASYDVWLMGEDGTTGTLLQPPFDNFSTGDQRSRFEEYAAFGDVSVYLNDRLDVTAGLRQSRNVQSADVNYSGLLTPPANTPSSSSGTDTSYLFTIRWSPTTKLSTYVRAASAYRPGGPQYSPSPQVPSSFGPDTDWDYEIGAKGSWFNGRLSADADVYYIRWTNIQLDALVDGVVVTGNGGDAQSEGAEFQGRLTPIDHLAIGVEAAFDQTRMDKINSSNTAGAVVGDPLPYIPKWSGSLSFDYDHQIAQANVSFGASYVYQGSRQSSFSADDLNTDVRLPAYAVVNLRARVDWKRYSASFQIDNVSNEYALANNETVRLFPGEVVPASGIPIQPRTFRLSLEARF